MEKKKYLIFVAAVILMVALIWVAVGKKKSNLTIQDSVRVGIIIPVSGPMAFVGAEVQRGLELAQQDYPNANLKIIIEDDQLPNNTASLNALNKLLNIDKVDLVFNSVVNSIKPLAPILSEKHVPGIILWDSGRVVSSLGDYVFGMGFGTELAGERMAEFAYKTLKVRQIAVITAHDEWSELISSAFIEKFKNLGGTIDLQEKVNLDEIDVRGVIQKIKQKNSEAIYFPLALQSVNSVARQARELGYSGHLFTADAFTTADIANLKQYAEGIYATNIWLQEPSFVTKYKTKYGEADPINLAFSAMGYDAVKLVVELTAQMKQKKIPINSETIRDNLMVFEMNGYTGKTVFGPERTANKSESILVVKNGKFELVDK